MTFRTQVPWLCMLCFAAIGCADADAEVGSYGEARVTLQPGHGSSRLVIEVLQAPGACPPEMAVDAFVNGVRVFQDGFGGSWSYYNDWPCQLHFTMPELPVEAATLLVTFKTPEGNHRDKPQANVDEWQVEVPWPTLTTWTEDDLPARMHEGGEFDIHWLPTDAPRPQLTLSLYPGEEDDIAGGWEGDKEDQLALVSESAGNARFRFVGPEPDHVWSVVAELDAPERTPLLCAGFERCSMRINSRFQALVPLGSTPVVPPDVAGPRLCIESPSHAAASTEAFYGIPDLSEFRIARREDCLGSDLYFAVLGACPSASGGFSTYAIGNRGTQEASFVVESNFQSIAGEPIAPQQFSKVQEIAYDAPGSLLRIVADNDCDSSNNAVTVQVGRTTAQ